MASNLITLRGLVVLLFQLIFISSCQSRQAPPVEEEGTGAGWMGTLVKAEDMPISASRENRERVNQILSGFSAGRETDEGFGSLVIALGESFLGTPYVAHTLGVSDTERLVVNLAKLDCTTFVENVLALALTAEQGKTGFEDFASLLAFLRYREAYPNGYASRLHYFSEWLQLHAQQGLLELVSDSIGSKPFDNRVSFMTTHPEAYPPLADLALLEQMKEVEKKVSAQQMRFIPREEIRNLEGHIQNGDVIAFTTDIEGLDVSHTGFAFFREGRLHLLHASTRSHSVEISPVPLSEYLAGLPRVTGILAGRVK